ncbi:MAG: transporter [Magnetococcales bacterium]|nr:outer membrane protein transport protein [Magnetococcales bacterium]NGZ27040.1 transporter [Magnetococcales bacterium]
MAGAGTALPMDTMATALNPALMVYTGDRLDIGLASFFPSRGFTANDPNPAPGAFPAGSYESDNSVFFIPSLGYNKMLTSDTSLGISIGGNGGMNTEYDWAVFGGFGAGSKPTGIDLIQLFVGVSLSHKISRDHSVGVAPILSIQSLSVKGLEAFQGLSVHPDRVTNKGRDWSYGGGVRVGWRGQLTDSFSAGISYQTRLWMSRFDKYSGLIAEEGDFDIPPIFNVGIAYKLTPTFTALADVQHIFFDDIKSLSNSNNTIMAPGSLGGSSGLGFGWEGMTVYKFGLQWVMNDSWTWRAGYSKASDVLAGGQALFNILAPATVTDHVTAGLTYKLSDQDGINFAGMHAFSKKIHGSNPNTPNQTGYLEMSQNELEISWSHKF